MSKYILIDFKTGQENKKYDSLQLAAYKLLFESGQAIEKPDENHSYFYQKKEVPSVTQVLKYCSRFMPNNTGKMDVGKYIHEAICLHILGELDIEKMKQDEEAWPVFKSFLGFIDLYVNNGAIIEGSEVSMYSCVYGFAGTIDLILSMNGGNEDIQLWNLYLSEKGYRIINRTDEIKDSNLENRFRSCLDSFEYWK